MPHLPAGHEDERVREVERGELVDEQLRREPPATEPLDVLVDPRRGEFVVDLDPAVGDELVERAAGARGDLGERASSVASSPVVSASS